MSPAQSRLVVVTVVKDDVEGLNRTCASLAMQTQSVVHLIIDGASHADLLDAARKWAQILGSTLISEPDRGPYDAMNTSLRLLEATDRVWFLNAGDTLATPDAYAYVAARTASQEFVWGFGPARILEIDGRLRSIQEPAEYSLGNHSSGLTPICHQAAVCRVDAIRSMGGFDERYPIAADYRLFLMLGTSHQPIQWEQAVVDYWAGGLSDRHLIKGHWEQHRARLEILGSGPMAGLRSWSSLAVATARITVGRGIDALARRGLIDSQWRARRASARIGHQAGDDT